MPEFNLEDWFPVFLSPQVHATVPSDDVAVALERHFKRMGKDVVRYKVTRNSNGEAQSFFTSPTGAKIHVRTVFREGTTRVSLEDEQ